MGAQCFPFDVRRLPADAATVDMLAKVQLAALRRGESIRLVNVPPDLGRLIDFVGLANVLRVEPRR
jgi:anti-anti-sigma regulatory factor